MFAERIRVLTATLWAGSLWTVGYLVAPLLFATLADRTTAGNIAGSVFHVEAWLSVFCAAVLILMEMSAAKDRSGPDRRRLLLLWLVLGMLGCTVIGYFVLHPFMASLRNAAGAGATMDAGASVRFGILHGISSVLYLIQSLLAVALVLKIR